MPDARRLKWELVILLVALIAAPAASQSLADAAKKKPKPPGGYPVLPGIYRLHGSDPSLSQEDLEPLRKIIGKAEIVALGESIHTSGGYYEMKHRVFRFLVQKMGFRAFAFESPWPAADRVAQYVETCGEDPAEALRGLFGVWQSAETRDLVEWMCEWNRSHKKKKDKLYFFGFDVQQPADDGPALIAFLERLGIGTGDPVVADVRTCDGVASRSVYPNPIAEADNQQCLRGLQAAEQLIEQEAQGHDFGISPVDLEYARLRLVGLRSWQGEVYYFGLRQPVLGTLSRDSGMAYAFGTLRRLRHGNIKTVVWAHNFHIAKDAPSSGWGAKTMGSFLREMFGESYAVIGLASFRPEIDWPSQGCGATNVTRTQHTVETRLHDLRYEALLVDFEVPGGNPPALEAGRNYQLSETGMIPVGQFDGLLFLEHSRKMDPLRWPSCQ